jgi:TolB-like protein
MSEPATQRRLAAILAADVVGYSRMMELDETGTLAALRERRRQVLEPVIDRHRGRIFKVTGDGTLAEFASAVSAVECAVDLQRQMAAANADLPEEKRIVVRIGVNLGDVMVEGSDLYGDGVNIAARLESIAEPGGIVISGTAHDHVRNKVQAGFDDRGVHVLKNLDEPVRVFAITGMRTAGTAKAKDDRPSIAVLPFANLSGEAEQQYFSDGVSEDIITELSRFPSLKVVARNSSFQYRGQAVDVRRVARDLGVRYVLEGSVRRMAKRVRISAQLIDAVTGSHVWAERYDRDLEGLFEVQDEVTRTIVATLIGRVENAEMKSARQKPTQSLRAYEALLRGIEHLRGVGDEENRRARELFETAIALDPGYALAHAYLCLALLVEHRYENTPETIKQRALDSGLTAVRLDPNESRCHQFIAQAYRFRGQFDLAASHAERGMALNPNDANGIANAGVILAVVGRAEEGIALIQQAMRLNPFHPDWYWAGIAIGMYVTRRYEEALAANQRLSTPTSYWVVARAAACLAQLGRLEEARAQAAEVLRLKPDLHLATERLSYKNPADAEHVREGMRKAGLPE